MEKLLKLSEVAEVLNVTEDRAYQMAREGILPCIHMGRQVRVKPEALESWLANGGKALPGGWKKAVD
ncbi:DNA-binding protein [Alicyclobacillaceae bacterium I2511]|nr:DNA-binding protein [Alicyclobacillaceae bacterium I2511]